MFALSQQCSLSWAAFHPILQNPFKIPSQTLNFTFQFFKKTYVFTNLISRSSALSLTHQWQQVPTSASADSSSSSSFLLGIANIKSWFQFYGDGFAIRVPPQFEDNMEPEDYNAVLSLYGEEAKPKTFTARFASADGW